jgi:hypothetical protein
LTEATANVKESGDVPGELELSEDARARLTELRALSEKAQAGDKEARTELRRLLRASSPEVIAEASGIARKAEGMLVKTISAGKPLMEEALLERMDQMRAEIAGENPRPLEVLLTERVVAGWLLVEVLEALIVGQYQRDVTAHRVPPAYVIQQSRILESATRRYLASIRELARVKKLPVGAPVQVNTQVNVSCGASF